MLHKQFEELTETGYEHAGIFFLNHATTYNNASVKVTPAPPPPPTPPRTKRGFGGFLSSNSVPNMSGICWFFHSAELRREDNGDC
jgi:hypothetical protein